jgi:CelD/BcsL family acetyltransferase involved in cellulose biosynthesis
MNALAEWLRCSSTMTASTVRGQRDVIDRVADSWRGLCDRTKHSPFCRPEWVAAYLRAFCRRPQVLVLTIEDGSALAAVLPLLETNTFCGIPARTLQTPGNFHTCRFEMATRTETTEEALTLLWERLKQEAWDVVELKNVPRHAAGERLLRLAQCDGWLTGSWSTEETPYMNLEGAREPRDVIPTGSFRRDIQHRIRKAARKCKMDFCRVDSWESPYLNEFYKLEMSGWKGKRGSAIACSPSTQLFYDEITRAATRFGYLTVHALQFDGHTVASQLGLEYGARYYSLKIAYDEQYAWASPGHLLVEQTLRDCIRRGVVEYDTLGPSGQWKRKWTTNIRPHSNCYIFRKSVRGRLACATKMELMSRLRWAARYPVVQSIRSKFISENQ